MGLHSHIGSGSDFDHLSEVAHEIEPGRYLVADFGTVVTKIREIKKQGSLLYYLVDAGLDTLVRPAMYGAYHHITIVPRECVADAQSGGSLSVIKQLSD